MTDNTEDLIFSVFRLGRSLRKLNEDCSKDQQDLSILQIHTLFYIKEKRTPRMTEIANHFGVTLPTATKMVERLVDSGLIKRSYDKEDRRTIKISLTEKGSKSLSQMIKQRHSRLKKVISFLPKQDINQLQRIINQVLLRIESSNHV